MNINRDLEKIKKLTHGRLELTLEMLDRAATDRASQTPITEAVRLACLSLPEALSNQPGVTFKDAAHSIMENLYGPMLKDKEFTEDAMKDQMESAFESGCCVDIVWEISAYCALGVKAFARNEYAAAWSFVMDAAYWCGVVKMLKIKPPLPKPGQILAKHRHKKTYEERAKVAKYWREHIEPKNRRLSAQKAADEILMAGVTDLGHKKIAEIVSLLRRGEFVR